MLIFSSFYYIIILVVYAGVMELADVMDSKSIGSDIVSVRVRPPVPKSSSTRWVGLLFCIVRAHSENRGAGREKQLENVLIK